MRQTGSSEGVCERQADQVHDDDEAAKHSALTAEGSAGIICRSRVFYFTAVCRSRLPAVGQTAGSPPVRQAHKT